jgi:pimeloyl-ACP methyl ester carboxylesterase
MLGLTVGCEVDPGDGGYTPPGDGNCPAGAICRNDEAPGAYAGNGPYRTGSYSLPAPFVNTPSTTNVFYPTNAEPPFAGIVFCPPFLTYKMSFAAWGPFFASHGIVLVTMDTVTVMDQVDQRDNEQRKVLDALKDENSRPASPLYGKLDTSKIGAMGWSMGGGATWINAVDYPGLKTAMTLAGHNLTSMDMASKGVGIRVPTLILNGATDVTILGGMGQSNTVYNAIPDSVPKVLCVIGTVGHFAWSSPTSAGRDVAELSLAFQKTFLEGDTRWAPFIQKPGNASTWKTSSIDN